VTWNWTGSTTLTRDNQLIGAAKNAGFAAFSVPADDGSYTLSVKGTRAVPWADLDTALDATWTFRSAPPADAQAHALPLLLVRASLPVDDHDSAVAGLPYLVPLEIERQAGAPAATVAELSLDVSYDDGATWQAAPLVFAGDRGLAFVAHPSTPGLVTLRAHAQDLDGNAVTQTVTRAYRTTALQ
jgi:hypothetical protein